MRPHSTSKNLVSKYRIPELRKVLNTRNPFSRIYSGWKDKFVISKFQNGSLTPQGVNYETYDFIAEKIKNFTGPSPPEGYKISFEKFVRHVVDSFDEYTVNIHFRSQTHICQPVSRTRL